MFFDLKVWLKCSGLLSHEPTSKPSHMVIIVIETTTYSTYAKIVSNHNIGEFDAANLRNEIRILHGVCPPWLVKFSHNKTSLQQVGERHFRSVFELLMKRWP
jgi:hypothetical protein